MAELIELRDIFFNVLLGAGLIACVGILVVGLGYLGYLLMEALDSGIGGGQ